MVSLARAPPVAPPIPSGSSSISNSTMPSGDQVLRSIRVWLRKWQAPLTYLLDYEAYRRALCRMSPSHLPPPSPGTDVHSVHLVAYCHGCNHLWILECAHRAALHR